VDVLHDNIGTSSCYGSGYILRRSALDEIGGWPQVPVGEDIFCGFLLAGRGWDIAFCSDILQHDLTPGSLDVLLKQRMRWVGVSASLPLRNQADKIFQMDGDLNLVKRFNFFLPGLDPCSKRTSVQRISAFINSVRLFRAVTDTVFPPLIAILFCTFQPRNITDSTVGQDYLVLKSLYLASILTDKLNSFLIFGSLSGLTNSDLWLSPCM
jgi:hypothetical protein